MWEYVGQALGKDGNWYTITGVHATKEQAEAELNPQAMEEGIAKVVRQQTRRDHA